MAQRARLNKANILVYGSNGVGKTALIVRYLTKRFIGEYDQNKESVYTHRLQTTGGGGGEMVLEILDPAQSVDDVQLESHVKWADGFLLIYSVTDRNSFSLLHDFQNLLIRLRTSDEATPIVLVANKTDCPPFARKVAVEEGQTLAQRYDRPLHEISVADSPDGVIESMESLIGQIKREYVKVKAGLTNQRSPFTNVKRVIKEKIYNRSRSDTTMVNHQ